MTTRKEKKFSKKITTLVAGSGLLVVGITLILSEWSYVVVIFKGAIGMALALAGLLVLMLIKD